MNDLPIDMKLYYAAAILGTIAEMQPSGKSNARMVEDMAMAAQAAKWMLEQALKDKRMEDIWT